MKNNNYDSVGTTDFLLQNVRSHSAYPFNRIVINLADTLAGILRVLGLQDEFFITLVLKPDQEVLVLEP